MAKLKKTSWHVSLQKLCSLSLLSSIARSQCYSVLIAKDFAHSYKLEGTKLGLIGFDFVEHGKKRSVIYFDINKPCIDFSVMVTTTYLKSQMTNQESYIGDLQGSYG